jgi:hypothetical protein
LIAEKKKRSRHRSLRRGGGAFRLAHLFDVDYAKAKDIFNVDLVDVPEEKILELVKKHHEKVPAHEFKPEFNPSELEKSLRHL